MRFATLSVLLAATSCGRVGYDVGAAADGSLADAGSDALEPRIDGGTVVSFGPPVPLSELNSGSHTHAPSLTADLLEIYFESTRSGTDEIWHATRASADVPFDAPELVTELNSPSGETSPEISADGLQIWFVSTRSPSLGEFDVWTARRASRDARWDPPEHVIELSSRFVEHGAAPSPDTLAIVVHSSRDDGSGGLFMSQRSEVGALWSTPEPVLGVNEPTSNEAAGHLGAGLTTLYFASDRPASAGERDLFVAFRATPTAPFDPPLPIEGVNTADFEDEPWVSPDGSRLVFARTDATSRSLYEAVRVAATR